MKQQFDLFEMDYFQLGQSRIQQERDAQIKIN